MPGVGFALPEPCLALIGGLYPGFPKWEPKKPAGIPATVQEGEEESMESETNGQNDENVQNDIESAQKQEKVEEKEQKKEVETASEEKTDDAEVDNAEVATETVKA